MDIACLKAGERVFFGVKSSSVFLCCKHDFRFKFSKDVTANPILKKCYLERPYVYIYSFQDKLKKTGTFTTSTSEIF